MSYVQEILEQVIKRNANEPEFHQAVKEVMESLELVLKDWLNRNGKLSSEYLGSMTMARSKLTVGSGCNSILQLVRTKGD